MLRLVVGLCVLLSVSPAWADRLCHDHIWPIIQDAASLHEEAQPEIERAEADGTTSPGFFRDHFDCGAEVLRMINGFSGCEYWDTYRVVHFYQEARVVKAVCQANLKVLKRHVSEDN